MELRNMGWSCGGGGGGRWLWWGVPRRGATMWERLKKLGKRGVVAGISGCGGRFDQDWRSRRVGEVQFGDDNRCRSIARIHGGIETFHCRNEGGDSGLEALKVRFRNFKSLETFKSRHC
ncbi:hypothetical protein Salat_2101300 [Sesamum alatum]|uniref:Uncharacterized protein n=1 Tax=Sesamum alatum TaxID=300844 RepID=A0AAE1Y0Z5_9LAMI|nr:hypothetical protein Salat_2101300 [Sesamum alatum]